MKIGVINKWKDIPAIIVNEEVYRKFKVAVIRNGNNRFPACIVASRHPDIHARLDDNDILVTPKILEIAQISDPLDLSDKLDIEFFSQGLFVYGTLLSSYVTPEGDIRRGWGGLEKYPKIRGICSSYALYYHELPYMIRENNSKSGVIGEIYLGVNANIERKIDNIELSANYKITRTKAKIIENFPLIRKIDVKLYEYNGKPSGIALRTMLFEEAYVVNKKMTYFQHDRFFSVLKGNSSIIITAPHGGYYCPLEMPSVTNAESDEETYALSREIITEIYWMSDQQVIPSAVLAKIHRSRVDLNSAIDYYNRRIAKEYHRMIENIGSEQTEILIDIHGMSAKEKYDIELGTNYGATVRNREDLLEEFRENLKKEGFSVVVDRKYTGGFTVRHHSQKDLIAIQIEINKRLRMPWNYKETAKRIAKAIWKITSI